jgi:hypothetical protein
VGRPLDIVQVLKYINEFILEKNLRNERAVERHGIQCTIHQSFVALRDNLDEKNVGMFSNMVQFS